MSELPPATPPLPAAAPEATADAIPMATVNYAAVVRHDRPGILNAIGIISIIVAAFSALACFSFLSQSILFYSMSSRSPATLAPPAPVSTVAPPAAAPAATSPATAPTDQSDPTTQPSAAPTAPATVVPPSSAVSTSTVIDSDGSSPPPSYKPLTPAQVSTVIARVRKLAGPGATPAQLATISKMLRTPNQQLLDPAMSWSPVQTAVTLPDGGLMVMFSGSGMAGSGGGMLQLDSAGAVTTLNAGNPAMVMGAFPGFRVSRSVALVVSGENVLSLLLDIYLFVIGILMLRDHHGARRAHLRYAVIKVVLAIVGGIAIGQLYSQMFTPTTSSSGMGSTIAMIEGIVFAGMGLVYPVALLIAMNSGAVRRYYAPS